jgi:hypothetical protein
MERLFSPCNRLYDLLESQGHLEEYHPSILQELNLDVSTEEFLSAERAFTYADLLAMLESRNTVAWLTPHAAIARERGRQLGESFILWFTADGKDIVAFARSHEHLLEICDIVLRLLTVSVVQSVILTHVSTPTLFINAPTLAYLMEQCQSLKVLTLEDLDMDEDLCRVLGAYSRPGLEIVLLRCKITRAGASALAKVLGRNQGPTKLDFCEIDNFVLADGLRGNSRLKVFTLNISNSPDDGNRDVFAIAGGLRQNKGLAVFNLSYYGFRVSGEALGAVCDSLKTHPTLGVMYLRQTFTHPMDTSYPAVPRIQAILDMLRVNITIHTIHMDTYYSEHELFRGSVVPYLETNRFRPRLLAIQRTRPIPYRAKVLGRALLSARTNPNHFWMLLSGNAEVALFPSTTATTTPAVNLPTPFTVAAP